MPAPPPLHKTHLRKRPKSPPSKARAHERANSSTALVVRPLEQVIPARRESAFEKLLADADKLADAAYAPSTERAYTADAKDWTMFAKRHPKSIPPPHMPITPDQLRAYIADLAKRKLSISTIRRRCAALSKLHRISGLPTPTKDPAVLRELQGLVRKRSVRQRKKEAFRLHHLITVLYDRKTKLRDRVILLVGLLTGMRRSEIVAVRWPELRETSTGIQIEIARSKTDQEGEGAIVPLRRVDDVKAVCPVRALEHWRKQPRETTKDGPDDRVFPVSDRTVARAVKRAVRLCGEDPSAFGGHSLRAGFMTLCDELGVPLHDAMAVSRHVTRAVAEGYIRGQTIMKNPAAVALAQALEKAGRDAAPSQPDTTLLPSRKKSRR